MKKIKILLLLLLLVNGGVFAQTFESYYLDPGVKEGDVSIISELDAVNNQYHYFSSSELPSASTTQRGVFVYKVDDAGTLLWRTKIKDPDPTIDYRSFSINKTENDIYVLGNLVDNSSAQNYIVLFVLDKNSGNLISTYKYQFLSTENVYGLNLMRLTDGTDNFVITGMLSWGTATAHKNIDKKALAMKVDRAGNVLWCNSYNSPPYVYPNYSGNFYDYDRLTYSVENTDKETIYCIGASTRVTEYQVPPDPNTYSSFSRANTIMKIDKNNGNIVWDNHNDYILNIPLSSSKAIIDEDKIVTLENYSEFINLVFRDHNGNFIRQLAIWGSEVFYTVGYSLMQDRDYYYITTYHNDNSDLFVFRVDKVTDAVTVTRFRNYDANFNVQEPVDYFSNFDGYNQTCYFQVNSSLQKGKINVVSGIVNDGVKFAKLDIGLGFVCTNEDVNAYPVYYELEEHPRFIESPETVYLSNISPDYHVHEIGYHVCYNSLLKMGIDDENTEDKLAYPNPSFDFIYLDVEVLSSIELYNNIGQLLNLDNQNYNYDGKQIKIDVSDLLPGVYLLKVNGLSHPFIKE